MPKTKISEFSATPANNTDIDSINIAEGCAPSGINDAIRELMAQLKDFQTGAVGDSFNGPIGATTASTGAFTTLSSTGNTTLGDASGDAVTINGTATFANANPTLTAGTANGVTFLNGSKVLTSGSALTFDASTLGVSTTAGLLANFNTTEANGPYIRFQSSGTSVGDVGTAAQIAGGAATDFAINVRSTGNLVFARGFTEAMRLTSTGLGIGTSSPAQKLSVVSSAGTPASFTSTASAVVLALTNSGATTYIGNDSASGSFIVQTPSSSFSTKLTVDNAGNLGLGVTPSAWSTGKAFEIGHVGNAIFDVASSQLTITQNAYYNGGYKYGASTTASRYDQGAGSHIWWTAPSGTAGNAISFTQAMTLDASGNLLVGTTNSTPAESNVAGASISSNGTMQVSRAGANGLVVNRKTDDGQLVGFLQDGTQEGNITVTGTTVSYNGGHLSRYAQTTTAKDNSLVKGTVLSNLDEMNVYTKDGQPVDNEQLNKVKVSDTEGDVNVAGVFVNWSHDEQHNVDEINMAMTGDMIIRIAQGVTVVRGDLLMSAGDGTAKPQGDDIIRSKTVAKVTSNHVTCTYADGSYCVPCVLMAC